jgi:hypothetical protein
MFASYQLGLVGGGLAVQVVPIFLAVIVVIALASPLSDESDSRGTGEHDSGWARFGLELERSRRHVRPMALVRITPARHSQSRHGLDPAQVEDVSRAVDAVWTDGRNVYLLMPETDRSALSLAIARLRGVLPVLEAADLRVAVYPEDGITSGAIIAHLDAPEAAPRPADIISLATHETDRQHGRTG